MPKWRVTLIALLCAVIVLAVALQCVFVMGEDEQAVRYRFGRVTDVYQGGGLHTKIPLVDHVETYSARVQTYISATEIVNTSDKKQFYHSEYAQWVISDPALYSMAFHAPGSVEVYLDNMIFPIVIQAVNSLTEVQFISDQAALNQAVTAGRERINLDLVRYGVEIIDIQVYRTQVPDNNTQSVYDRMTADRAQVAQQLRSEGEEAYNNAVAEADLEARQMEAAADSQAGQIRAEVDAAAMAVRAGAYAKDAAFFEYWRSLQALEAAFEGNTTLVLDPANPLLKDLLSVLEPSAP
jgi:membrane protease subunit HflC